MTRIGSGFVLLYETNDRRFPAFTFEVCDYPKIAIHWKKLPEAIYGKNPLRRRAGTLL